ncbi:MAG: PepSY-associated TM helix domain-containing protein [Dokdonella sp.]
MPKTFQRALLRRVLFRLHWIAGITAGLVLGVVGFTGGIVGCEEAVLRWLNPPLHAAAENRSVLPPDRWVTLARAAYPESSVRNVAWAGAGEAVRLRIVRDGGRGIEIALDPHDGKVLGVPRGTEFFASVEQLHRTLAAGPVGKQIVGASTLAMIVMIVTGIYLRWPRRTLSVSAWFKPNLRAHGRGFLWQLHAVAGTWLLAFYLCAALTGLWWSYDFYRSAVNAIAGVPTPTKRPPPATLDKNAPGLSVDRAWSAFLAAVPDATLASFSPSAKADAPLEIRYQTSSSEHDRAWNTIKVDLQSGEVVANESYSDQPRGRRFVAALFPLHSGSFFGVGGRTLMAIAALLMPFFSITGLWLWLLRRRNDALRNRMAAVAPRIPQQPDTCAG